jgi:hypothetical protein
LVGSYNDPVFGSVKTGFFTQILPSVYNDTSLIQDMKNNVDSAVLFLKINKLYAAQEFDQKIKIHPAVKNFTNKKTSAFNITDYYDAGITANDTTKNLYFKSEDSVITFKIDKSFIENYLLQSDTVNNVYADQVSFQNYFKGLYLTTNFAQNSNTGAIAYTIPTADTSKIRVFYTSDSALYFDYLITSDCYRLNISKHNYQGSQIETVLNDSTTQHPNTYIQAMGGAETIIKFKDDSVFKKHKSIVNAQLIIPVEENTTSKYEPPERLALKTFTLGNTATILPDDPYYTNSYEYFDGGYNEDEMTYTFNITRYIQKLACRDNSPDYCNSNEYQNKLILYTGAYNTDNKVIYNATIANRVVLKSAQQGNGMKLVIYHSNY